METDNETPDSDPELQAVEKVVDRLAEKYPHVAHADIVEIVSQEHERLEGNPIRDFVAVLVEHSARDRIRQSQ